MKREKNTDAFHDHPIKISAYSVTKSTETESFLNIPSTPRGYLTPPPPRPLQPYPRSCTVVILNLSRDRRKMAINLKKNGDSLRKTWQQVFDDSSDVNWWVFHPNFHPNQTIWWHSFSFQGRVWVWWQDKRSESGRNRRYVVRKFRCIWHDIS